MLKAIFFSEKQLAPLVFYKTETALEFYLLQHFSCIEVVEEGNEWFHVEKIVFTFAFNHSEHSESSETSDRKMGRP
ncbi:MAG: hypothetical protein JSV12_01040 [Candidatus Bathyarchaeota archaeon]|nr:MAG: hypothetical protein JSV12_01040 [Candidatus Bathyarchaeota archaeon]